MVWFSAASMFFHEYACDEIFSFVSRAGMDAIEFWPETPDFWLNGQSVERIIACRKACPELVTLTIHAPILDLNPCSINPGVADLSVEFAVRSIELGRRLGARLVTVHPGRRTAKRPPTPADLARFDHYLASLREASGTSGVRICMENMEPAVNALIHTPERMREVLDEEPWLGFTLDVGHALVGGPEEPARYIELCHDRLENVHMSRVERGRPHFPLARNPDIAKILEQLKNHGFRGGLTLELEDLNFDHVLSYGEKIAALAEDCAFMRECMR